jgi:hypothetical protein
MKADNANQHLHDLLVTRDFDPIGLAPGGYKQNVLPKDAVSFSFDYKSQSGKNYGTAVVSISNDGLSLFFGDNLGKTMESKDKSGWFSFLSQLKNFAVRENLPGGFNIQDLSKLKYSLRGQAALSEGWTGTKTQSWNGKQTEARLMIKHKRVIGENDARYRYIESLFLETADGERFKLPFTKLTGGRAMLEHVKQGGKPYDIRGNHIVTMVQEMNLLSRFKRANQGRIFEEDTAQLVESANIYYDTLQHNLKSLSSKMGYKKYFESWDPAEITDEDVIIEDLRHMFVEKNIDSRVEQALPLLAKLQQEQKMKEANIFEQWANFILEDNTQDQLFPETSQQQAELINLLSKELPVGADAFNVISQLDDIFVDGELAEKLKYLAQENPDADARDTIKARLEELKDIPAIGQIISQLPAAPSDTGENIPTDNVATATPDDASTMPDQNTPTDNVATATPDDASTMPDQNTISEITRLAGIPMEENGQYIETTDGNMMETAHSGEYDFETTILNPEWLDWESSDDEMAPEPKKHIEVNVSYDTDGEAYDASWGDAGGDPGEGVGIDIISVTDSFTKEEIPLELLDLESLEQKARDYYTSNMEESVKNPHTQTEDPRYTKQPTVIPDELDEDRSSLAGPYGHSGRMTSVAGINADMMDRIKFLAGITK